MARQNVDAWIPEEFGSQVLQIVNQVSAVEEFGRKEPMAYETKMVPRSGTVDVTVTAKGTAYAESGISDGEVLLSARKFTGLIRLAEEDIADLPENIVAIRQQDWAKGYAVALDNAALGVTAVEDGTSTAPFTSVYRHLANNDASANYTGMANIVQSAGTPTYAQLSKVLGIVEQGPYFGELVIIASPAFRAGLRNIVDNQSRPIFIQGTAGTPDTLFGLPIKWSRGAVASTGASNNPVGHPLLVVVEKNHLILGVRSGPETAVVNGFTGASALTDEALIKMRARRGFQLGHPSAAAILEWS